MSSSTAKPPYKPPAALVGPILTKPDGLQYQLTEQAVFPRKEVGTPEQKILHSNFVRTQTTASSGKRSTRKQSRKRRKQSRKQRR